MYLSALVIVVLLVDLNLSELINSKKSPDEKGDFRNSRERESEPPTPDDFPWERSAIENTKESAPSPWNAFQSQEFIYYYIDELVNLYSHLVSKEVIGKSVEGRDIIALTISNKNSTIKEKKGVLIDGGIHAREWLSVSTVFFLTERLIVDYDKHDMLNHFIIYIIPIVNPDGYEYSRSGGWDARMWRKNRRKQGDCIGTDLNRNFPADWNTTGVSTDHCEDIYPGETVLSEPESKALANFMKTHKLTVYVTFHSYGQIIAYPYAYKAATPSDSEDLNAAAQHAVQVMIQNFGIKYKAGNSGVLLGLASGGSDDYAKLLGIKYSYTWELPDRGFHGFLVPPSYIYPVGVQTYTGLLAMLSYLFVSDVSHARTTADDVKIPIAVRSRIWEE